MIYESWYCCRDKYRWEKKIDFKWLEDIDDKTFNLSKEKWGPGEYGLGSDIGVVYYVKKYYKGADVEILTKKDVSLKRFNEFDIIFGLLIHITIHML